VDDVGSGAGEVGDADGVRLPAETVADRALVTADALTHIGRPTHATLAAYVGSQDGTRGCGSSDND